MASTFVDKFTRVAGQNYIPAIDGLRFLAIVPVVLMHYNTAFKRSVPAYADMSGNWLNEMLILGDVGVSVFFAISGFILGLPFARHYLFQEKEVSLKKYFLKRLTRLEPPYIITLFLFFIVHILVKTAPVTQLLPHVGASLLYLHNMIYGKWSLINPVAWSLEIEIQFYLLAPLLAMVFKVAQRHWRIAIYAVFMLVLVILQKNIPLYQYHLQMSFLSHGQYFILGLVFIDFFLAKNESRNVWFDVVGVTGIFLLFYLNIHQLSWLAKTVTPIAILVIFIAAFKGKLLHSFFSNVWVSRIGGMCYITYLIHYPLSYFLVKFTRHIAIGTNYEADMLLQYAVALPIIFSICAIAFVVLEKPFMYADWPARLRQRIQQVIA